jgi:hypothetical protein
MFNTLKIHLFSQKSCGNIIPDSYGKSYRQGKRISPQSSQRALRGRR